jgi:hypothetical protein
MRRATRAASSSGSGREGKEAPEGPTPEPIVMCSEPGRLAVRELDAAPPANSGSR